MERIEPEIRRELRRFGAPGGLPELVERWPELVGAELVRHAWPARIARDGTLHVATSSATWAFELAQLAPELLARLSEALGSEAPSRVRFAPGHLPEAAAAPLVQRSDEPARPDPEDVENAGRLVAGIDDEDLRERVRDAVALSLLRARSGRSVW